MYNIGLLCITHIIYSIGHIYSYHISGQLQGVGLFPLLDSLSSSTSLLLPFAQLTHSLPIHLLLYDQVIFSKLAVIASSVKSAPLTQAEVASPYFTYRLFLLLMTGTDRLVHGDTRGNGGHLYFLDDPNTLALFSPRTYFSVLLICHLICVSIIKNLYSPSKYYNKSPQRACI